MKKGMEGDKKGQEGFTPTEECEGVVAGLPYAISQIPDGFTWIMDRSWVGIGWLGGWFALVPQALVPQAMKGRG